MCNLSEVPGRRPTWERIRARYCEVAGPICPDLDEPRVVELDRSFVVCRGAVSCEIGNSVVRNDREAAAYGAIVFHMVPTGKADDEYRRRLHVVILEERAGATTRPPGTRNGDPCVIEGAP